MMGRVVMRFPPGPAHGLDHGSETCDLFFQVGLVSSSRLDDPDLALKLAHGLSYLADLSLHDSNGVSHIRCIGRLLA